MAIPLVVIIGRPNVGKSTLFNRMTKTHAAIVEDYPGVTRDRNYLEAEWEDNQFIVVDTGGFYPDPPDDIFTEIKEQALFAIAEGDVVIHLLDCKDGLTPSDIELSRLLRSSGKTLLCAVNKVDGPTHEQRLYEFYEIGADELWPLSAATGYGYDDFMDHLITLIPSHREETSIYPKVAVVGKPNVGKSTLVNALLGKNRMIVSPVPGTTRDSIDSLCSYYGKKYLFIDTAGIRRKDKIGYSISRFSMVRSLRSIERSDIALIVLDAANRIAEQDQKIAGIVESYGKSAVFLLNKWDLVDMPEESYKKISKELYKKMWFMHYVPMLTVSALWKKRLTKVFPLIYAILRERKKRIPTATLNKCMGQDILNAKLSTFRGKRIKIYYTTQVGTSPPAFAVFTNYPLAFKEHHIRYIEKMLRNQFVFNGTPIRIYIKPKEEKKDR
jgi:GTP-binding protein